MPLSPIFESFNQDRSRSGTTDLCINLYPETIIGNRGPEVSMLVQCPGLGAATLASVGSGPIRGTYRASNNKMYVVSGNGWYLVDASWNATFLATINSSSGPVRMIDNPTQVLVVDGLNGWVANKLTNEVVQVIPNSTTSDSAPTSAIYQDGFGLVNSVDNQIFQSNYNDLTSFATLNGGNLGSTANNAFVQGNPQNVVAMFELSREAWIFKKDAVEVWINSGNPGFAFTQLQGVYIPYGCSADFSVARIGKRLFWLGGNDEGDASVYMSEGYDAKNITPPALSQLFQSFSTVSDSIAYTYNSLGHNFYVLTFPTANATYCFDITTGKWHQRASFSDGQFNREIANCHCYFNGQHIVGDYRTGNLYVLSDNTYTDNGATRKWLRTWRALPSSVPQGVPMSFDQLQILMQTGVSVPDGTNPQIMLRWSDDGGLRWIGQALIPAGKTGETAWRAEATRLGSTKMGTGLDRVWEISGTDPIPIMITGADWEGGPE